LFLKEHWVCQLCAQFVGLAYCPDLEVDIVAPCRKCPWCKLGDHSLSFVSEWATFCFDTCCSWYILCWNSLCTWYVFCWNRLWLFFDTCAQLLVVYWFLWPCYVWLVHLLLLGQTEAAEVLEIGPVIAEVELVLELVGVSDKKLKICKLVCKVESSWIEILEWCQFHQ